jgi:hypothetical protein
VEYFFQVNVRGVNDVRQGGIRNSDPLLPKPGFVEVEITIENMKMCKLPGMMKFHHSYSGRM